MQELMKMLGEMLKDMAGKNDDDVGEETSEDAGKASRVKHACATVLADMRREIHSLEHTLAVLNAKREMLIEEHDALVVEVKALEKEQPVSAKSAPEAESDSQGNEPPPEEKTHEDERRKEEEPPESELNLEGMSRLERLRLGLDHAIKVLDGSKMAFHFKAIKQLRLDLIELSGVSDKPENERIAELELGLKNAIDVLSNSPNAANSKTMRQLWNDLIVVLKQ